MFITAYVLQKSGTPTDYNITIFKKYQPFSNITLNLKSSAFGNYVDASSAQGDSQLDTTLGGIYVHVSNTVKSTFVPYFYI